jgi:hypothetical protein
MTSMSMSVGPVKKPWSIRRSPAFVLAVMSFVKIALCNSESRKPRRMEDAPSVIKNSLKRKILSIYKKVEAHSPLIPRSRLLYTNQVFRVDLTLRI